MQSVDASGDVMTPFGVLGRTAIEAQGRAAVDVVPCTPRTRARSDQFNPEAEHALVRMSPRSGRVPHKPDAERDADSLFDEVVPYAGLNAEARVSDHGGQAPSCSKVRPFLSQWSPGSSDGCDDENGFRVTSHGQSGLA